MSKGSKDIAQGDQGDQGDQGAQAGTKETKTKGSQGPNCPRSKVHSRCTLHIAHGHIKAPRDWKSSQRVKDMSRSIESKFKIRDIY
ncbi:unnamed protein product [Ambrosiozyma monospora]|uniref:Unnamed protein product n=1 Tax=Ambrosiozyma monospora TaxID=43982 RepID=A0A9W6Z4K4_AMBMO|nr:unnamed protein product [Ambrosiozyma monospora]